MTTTPTEAPRSAIAPLPAAEIVWRYDDMMLKISDWRCQPEPVEGSRNLTPAEYAEEFACFIEAAVTGMVEPLRAAVAAQETGD